VSAQGGGGKKGSVRETNMASNADASCDDGNAVVKWTSATTSSSSASVSDDEGVDPDETSSVSLNRSGDSSSSSSSDDGKKGGSPDDDDADDESDEGGGGGSVILNELSSDDDGGAASTLSAIALLRQIFPELPAHELRTLHLNRCSSMSRTTGGNMSGDGSPHGSEFTAAAAAAGCAHPTAKPQLPDDFLRLPVETAVRRWTGQGGSGWHYVLVKDLERRAVAQHEQTFSGYNYCYGSSGSHQYCTKVLSRGSAESGGLGMTLMDDRGCVRVQNLVGLSTDDTATTPHESPMPVARGQALLAGIMLGDVLIGVNGDAFVQSAAPTGDSLVRHAVSRIRSSPDPVVLHFWRGTDPLPGTPVPSAVSLPLSVRTNPSLLDTSDMWSEPGDLAMLSSLHSDLSCSQSTPVRRNSRDRLEPHPFVKRMAKRGLVHSMEEQIEESRMLLLFESRASQWEELSMFQIPAEDAFVPLGGVRKALSVRIVNMFEDGDTTAYTVWVYDVESGHEWYAPVRYLRDFEDLRAATSRLCRSVDQIPFPKTRSALVLFRSPSKVESNVQRETKCRQLECFLRSLCAMIYKERMHPYMAEVAIHLQSFLGCDDRDLEMQSNLPDIVGTVLDVDDDDEFHTRIRERLKRSLQRYAYRLFLLEAMSRTVDNFVDSVRTRGPSMQDVEALESLGRDKLKARAMDDLLQIQQFLDRVQDMILEGCMDDFVSIAERPGYASIQSLIRGSKASAGYWDRLVREAVREQVEIEIYVPLRSVVSRWIVYGWRHEDMEIQFRIKELRTRPQVFFRNTRGDKALDWSSVASILNAGVGLSTLPCVKLRAIVDAAREIFRISSSYSKSGDRCGASQRTGEDRNLGADDFLPIFIYCVVLADLERPCALCVLLRTLCDRINKIGEIGYYLLTFEAAITHCQEVDLTEERQLMDSFLSIPLDDP
jgi:Vacuolar sorting protein 9 (VPS9) domain